MSNKDNVSIYLSFLLRHKPEEIGLHMDEHGWVFVDELLERIGKHSKYQLDMDLLEDIVRNDNKGRYRFSEDKKRIKACQGHSIPWVIPELTYPGVPAILYHGTTKQAYEKILKSGYIWKMKRHAVHMSADKKLASMSAKRRKGQEQILLVIDAKRMEADSLLIGKSENDVWCIEKVDVQYIKEVMLLDV